MIAETTDEETLFTVPQIAEKLNVSTASVQRLIKSEQLKSVKVLGSRRITASAFRGYLEVLKSGGE